MCSLRKLFPPNIGGKPAQNGGKLPYFLPEKNTITAAATNTNVFIPSAIVAIAANFDSVFYQSYLLTLPLIPTYHISRNSRYN
jgi:hypothetical protein